MPFVSARQLAEMIIRERARVYRKLRRRRVRLSRRHRRRRRRHSRRFGRMVFNPSREATARAKTNLREIFQVKPLKKGQKKISLRVRDYRRILKDCYRHFYTLANLSRMYNDLLEEFEVVKHQRDELLAEKNKKAYDAAHKDTPLRPINVVRLKDARS